METEEEKSNTKSTQKRRVKRGLRIFGVALLVLYGLVWWHTLRIVEHDNWPPPEDAVTAAQSQKMAEDFLTRDDVERDDAAISYAPSTASDVQLFLDGTQFYPKMMDDMESAEHSIHLIMFGFTPGGWGDTFADILIQKQSEGVEVRLIVDGQGSKPTRDNSDFFNRMVEGGIQIVVNDSTNLQWTGELPDRELNLKLNEIGHSDHRKMFVVDGRIGWVGGAGLEDHFYGNGWLDTYARVEGDIVLQLQAVFCTSFHAYSGDLPGDLTPYFPKPEVSGGIRVTVLQNFPNGFVTGTQATRELLKSSSSSLDIMNAYFTDDEMLDHIVDAAERGVDVRILAGADSNVFPAQYALMSQYDRMMDTGIEIVEVPGVLHAKVAVADDSLILGSINYDAWALYRNVELSLLFEDAGVADAARAQLVEPTAAQGHPADRLDGWQEEIPARFWWWLRYYI